ncbi:peroxidase-related enzyme [Saccharopolyspora tripterygii]
MTTVSAAESLTVLRPDVREAAENADAAVLRPDHASQLDHADRARIALRVALVNESPSYADAVSAELGADDADVVRDVERWGELPEATQALLAHCEQVALDPADAGAEEIAELRHHFSPAQVVTATQVAAYASFRVRLESGLRLVADAGDGPASQPGLTIEAGAAADGFALSTPDQAFPSMRWVSWVVPGGEFVETLKLDAAVLSAQALLREAIMTGHGALDRADRELAALATSLINGCGYCTAVHGKRQVELSGDPLTAVALAEAGPAAITDERLRAVVDVAGALSYTPAALGAADIRRLHAVGLDADDVHDLVAVGSMFAWDNRLIMTLGNASRS